MYKDFFRLTELPFSIVPNSRFLYLSQRHKEAMRHLKDGLGDGGGFAMLTGEVGTGKTTVAKALLRSLKSNAKAGFILNPTFSSQELLEAICDEYDIAYQPQSSLKQLTQAIYQYLLDKHSQGVLVLLVIDEAQHLAADVLEQLRLLTNFETESRKLLKVLLIGQPELQQKLQMPQLRQLAQRITGRYHLLPLDRQESINYIQYRVELAGGDDNLFSPACLKVIAEYSQGIPRLINLVCDASLKKAYQLGEALPSRQTVEAACIEVMSFQTASQQTPVAAPRRQSNWTLAAALVFGVSLATLTYQWTPTLSAPYIARYLQQAYPVIDVEPIEHQVLSNELVEQLLASSQVEPEIETLYQLWGFQPSFVEQLCQPGGQGAFYCQAARGDLEQLSALNQPVVLTLRHQGTTGYAVLYRLDQDQMELLVNGQHLKLESRWLAEIWRGEYRYIWQRYWSETLKPGMRGESVALLEQRLAQVLGEISSNSDRYDQQLKRRVEMFQQWQGLDVDGIAGQQTLRRLEELSQQQAPRLSDLQEDA
ncbi:AAA family ATPase [Vibrio sp.]|uniref:ExeA family protein n=1 Tax=Vibrio sp. TaxID=678 RepID=UPI003D0E7EA9